MNAKFIGSIFTDIDRIILSLAPVRPQRHFIFNNVFLHKRNQIWSISKNPVIDTVRAQTRDTMREPPVFLSVRNSLNTAAM